VSPERTNRHADDAQDAPAAAVVEPVRAIVVDDSAGIRTLVARFLAEAGFEVLQAADGLKALACLDGGPPVDLAIVDWKMPRMDGYALLRALRSDPANDGMRILLATTETDVLRVMRALDEGASEYLMKPFTRASFMNKLVALGLAPVVAAAE